MNGITLSDNFFFWNLNFEAFHYTDNRKGAPLNYLAHMVKGSAKIVSDLKAIEINEGDIFYIPKNLSYQSYWYGNDKIKFLSFGFSELFAKDNSRFELQIIPCAQKTVDKILTIPTQGNNVDCKALSIFYDVMSEVIPHLKCSADSNNESTVNRIKECIRKNPHAALSEIAVICSISEPYLYSLFKKVTHTTPNDYRQKVLCEMGVELLITTDKKVEEISSELNFSSGSYFRKVLKKHTGLTPREIRKNNFF